MPLPLSPLANRQPATTSAPVTGTPSATATAPAITVAPFALQTAPPGLTGTFAYRMLAWGSDVYHRTVSRLFPGKPSSAEPIGGGGGTYTVQSGDSLSKIAQKALGDSNRWREIFEANRDQIANPNVIQPGQVLKLPGGNAPAPAPSSAPAAPASYTVQSGDTLSKIAQKTLGNSGRWNEVFEANRHQLSNPNLVYPGMVLAIPGGSAPSAPAPGPAPSSGGFGSNAVAAGRQLQSAGYRYTVNLTSNYHPVRFKIGCCADFAVDAWAKAGTDIYNRINNPHYCPNLVNYFKGGNDGHKWVGKSGAAAPGDMVFFDWDGSGDADHVAIVTEVDGNGKPTKIIESYNFNLAVRERAIGNSMGNVIGYGRA